MIVGVSLLIMIVLSLLSIVLGNDFISATMNTGLSNESLINGSTTTVITEAENVLFTIDTSSIVGAITILSVTVIVVASITGISIVGSGLNPQSARIIILVTAYVGLWLTLSLLAYNLIAQIEIFGGIIYVSISIAYVIGVIQKLSGGND